MESAVSDTLNIIYPPQAPGTFSLTYSVGGSAPNLSTGYTASMRVWRNGSPVTAGSEATFTQAAGITLGTAGGIILQLTTIESVLIGLHPNESSWHYTLTVTPTAGNAQYVCGGSITRAQP